MDDDIILAALIYSYFINNFQVIFQILINEFELAQQNIRRRAGIELYGPRHIVKSGTHSHLFMEMSDHTFRSHLRLTRQQFEWLNNKLGKMRLADTPPEMGGHTRVPQERKTLMFLWYMANNNSFRELSDKFDVSQSTAHSVISQALEYVCIMASELITWPNECRKYRSSVVFSHQTRIDKVIGAIDGCHIRIIRPSRHGLDYLNRKGYHSVLLQGICDEKGRFIDIFVGPPGRIHDSRLLRLSPFYENIVNKMGAYKLLGDSAYISQDFKHFIYTPKRDNGQLQECDRHANMLISRGRVIIENAFGRLKCRFRRIRDIQNTHLLTVVRLVIAACTLHNLCMDSEEVCDEHPNGCPRPNDENNI